MLVKLLKSKLHHARVTDSKLNYQGSLGIDSDLMQAVGILPYEFILVADLDNGNRLETYAVPEKAGSSAITVMGAAARLINTGDTIIIFAYGLFTEEEAKGFKPKVVILDENNKITKTIT